jgi:hypothetical protein
VDHSGPAAPLWDGFNSTLWNVAFAGSAGHPQGHLNSRARGGAA